MDKREARPVSVQLLGGFALSVHGDVVPLSSTAERLLAFLALQDRARRRAAVAGTLWLDVAEEHSGASLRSALWRLRQAGGEVVTTSGADICLHPSVVVDVRAASAAA